MDLFGANLAGQDLVKVLPAFLTAVAAALRFIPSIVTSARSRRSHALRERDSQLRIAAYVSPPPFPDFEFFSRRYYATTGDDPEAQTARRAMRTRTLRLLAAGILVATLFTGAYLIYGLAFRRLPNWSLILALVLGFGIAVVLARTYREVGRDPQRATAAKTQEGEVLVAGCEADVRQHSLAALIDMGARLVRVEGAMVLAATGTSFGTGRWKGEVIWVALSNEPPGHIRVLIRSTKVDFVSRSRSRRNVVGFLESWATFPSGPRADAGS